MPPLTEFNYTLLWAVLSTLIPSLTELYIIMAFPEYLDTTFNWVKLDIIMAFPEYLDTTFNWVELGIILRCPEYIDTTFNWTRR